MKAVIIGDIHLSDKPPSIRTESYASDILLKLEFAVSLAKKRDVECIISAGDVFHIKTPSRTSHRLVQDTHKVLTAAGIEVIIVPGNHDLLHDRIESLDGQPLGALGRMEGITILDGPHDMWPIYGLPYMQSWTALPARLRDDYKPWADELVALTGQVPLLVTHAPIFPAGQDPPYEYISAPDWAELMQAGNCYYGHIHDPHGAYTEENGRVVMCNNGALSRGSLHAETLKREPAVTVYDDSKIGTAKFEVVKVPVRPVEEVFSLALKLEADGAQQKLTDFLSGLDADTVQAQSVEQVSEHVRSMTEVSDTVRARAVELVEWAMGETK